MRRSPKTALESPDKGDRMRINQFLARSGVASRRAAESLGCRFGLVVNGTRLL